MSLTHRAAALVAVLLLTAVPFAGGEPPEVPLPDQPALPPDAALEALLAQAAAAVAEAQASVEGAAGAPPPEVEALLAQAAAKVAEAQAAVEDGAAGVPGTAAAALAEASAAIAAASGLLQDTAPAQLEAAFAAIAAARIALDERGDAGLDTACRHGGAALTHVPIVVWTSCNMGFGSGLDADTLDGLGSDVFLGRIDAEALARVTGDDALAARLDGLDLDIDGRAWAAVLARDGGGSALDADRLDGLDSARFVQYGANGNVGIGTANPSPFSTLHVARSDNGGVLTLQPGRTDGQNHIYLAKADGSTAGYIGLNPGEGRLAFAGNQKDTFLASNVAANEPLGAFVYLQHASGNVGIGTTGPAYKLDVAGPARMDGLIVPLTSAIAAQEYGAYTWGAYGFDDGPVRHVANTLDFITESKQGLGEGKRPVRMKISENGNVGVGTTSPGSKLDVRYDSGAGVRVGTTSSAIGSFDWTPGKALLYGLSGYGLGLGSDNQEHVTIDTAGNVGIGTTSPTRDLDVAGTIGAHSIYGRPDSKFILSGHDNGFGGGRGLELNAVQEGIDFQTHHNGWASRMRITDDGNVGIGTTSPFEPLRVTGPGYNQGSLGADGDLLDVAVFYPTGRPGVMLGGTSEGRNGGVWTTHSGADLLFGTFVDGLPKERVRIANGGNVGIGTLAPQSSLEVNGYVQLARVSGAPPSSDCDSASERGRMKVDSAAGLLYVCMDSGWVGK